MKSIYLLLIPLIFIGCSARSNQPVTASEEDISMLRKTIEEKNAAKAFAVLNELKFATELKVSEDVAFFYQEEPNFNS